MAVMKLQSVILSTREGAKSLPVSLSAKYLTKELGRPVSPSLVLTSHCQSVIGQYPKPNQKPRITQEASVMPAVIRWAFLVFGQIQAKRLNPIKARCRIVKNMSSAWSKVILWEPGSCATSAGSFFPVLAHRISPFPRCYRLR